MVSSWVGRNDLFYFQAFSCTPIFNPLSTSEWPSHYFVGVVWQQDYVDRCNDSKIFSCKYYILNVKCDITIKFKIYKCNVRYVYFGENLYFLIKNVICYYLRGKVFSDKTFLGLVLHTIWKMKKHSCE